MDGAYHQIEKFVKLLSKMLRLLRISEHNKEGWLKDEINHYCLLIKANQKYDSKNYKYVLYYEFKLVCMTPSLAIQAIARQNPRSIIFTSGTLCPLVSWVKELKIPL